MEDLQLEEWKLLIRKSRTYAVGSGIVQRAGFASAVVDKLIYFCGGRIGSESHNL